jgi:hypothetical protein
MDIKIKCADKEAREEVVKACETKAKERPLTESEKLLCDIVPFADDCPVDK